MKNLIGLKQKFNFVARVNKNAHFVYAIVPIVKKGTIQYMNRINEILSLSNEYNNSTAYGILIDEKGIMYIISNSLDEIRNLEKSSSNNFIFDWVKHNGILIDTLKELFIKSNHKINGVSIMEYFKQDGTNKWLSHFVLNHKINKYESNKWFSSFVVENNFTYSFLFVFISGIDLDKGTIQFYHQYKNEKRNLHRCNIENFSNYITTF